jgi:hypothetical protein
MYIGVVPLNHINIATKASSAPYFMQLSEALYLQQFLGAAVLILPAHLAASEFQLSLPVHGRSGPEKGPRDGPPTLFRKNLRQRSAQHFSLSERIR